VSHNFFQVLDYNWAWRQLDSVDESQNQKKICKIYLGPTQKNMLVGEKTQTADYFYYKISIL